MDGLASQQLMQHTQHVLYQLPQLTAADNIARKDAEDALSKSLEGNPDHFLISLVQIGLDSSVEVPVRQSALLFAKRTIPMYWSPAFDSFKGPSCYHEETKKIIRSSLLELIGDPISKIRSAANYTIVQISAVDLPDQWPELLPTLSSNITAMDNKFKIIGSLAVMHEIFDDVIGVEQLFNEGVAENVLKICNNIFGQDGLTNDIKIESLKLLKSVITIATSLNVDNNISAKKFIKSTIDLLFAELNKTSQFLESQLSSWEIINLMCDILDLLSNAFFDFFANENQVVELVIEVLSKQEPIYNKHLLEEVPLQELFNDFEQVTQLTPEPKHFLTNSISKELEFLQTLVEINHTQMVNLVPQTCELLIKLNYLPNERHTAYVEDFNEFVTDETDLSIDNNVRMTFMDFFRQLNIEDSTKLANILVSKLFIAHNDFHPYVESMLFILQTLLDSDDGLLDELGFSPLELLKLFITCINDRVGNLNHESQILISRLIIICPKLIYTYKDQLEGYGLECLSTIVRSIEKFPSDDDFNVIRASILISFQYFNHFIRAKNFGFEIQQKMIQLFNLLLNSSNEDTLIMLLESMSIIISIDNKVMSAGDFAGIFTNIISIGMENSSNFTIVSSVLECIQDYIEGIPMEQFINLISKNFDVIFSPLNDQSNDFKPEIDFSLQLLEVVVTNHEIPQELFNLVFKYSTDLILRWDDDQIIQSSTQLLIKLCDGSIGQVSEYQSDAGVGGPERLLEIVSKLLDPQMSDRAIFKLGDLISLILENFSQKFHQYLEDIMRGLTVRLSKAKEIPTIENLILIFNKLTIEQPGNVLDFLSNFQLEEGLALNVIFPIWFNAFEVMRGYESIYSNVCAFIKIFQLHDPRLEFAVNGDEMPMDSPEGVIITRSMAKRYAIKYYQIPANAKIIKLLLREMKNEAGASGPAGTAGTAGSGAAVRGDSDSDEDGWEDFDDADIDFADLKHYVDPRTGDERRGTHSDILHVLRAFFAHETATQDPRFAQIYADVLSDAERKLLAEHMAFG